MAEGERLRPAARWGTLLAFLAPFVLYLSTMAPTIYNLDSAELTTAAATGGLVRATGYPLYLMLGRVWSQLPVGDVGYRMNLLSVVCGALTVALAHRILRYLGVGPWAAVGALGLLASARFFWALSLVAEVYTLHTVFLCAIVLALLRWARRPNPRRLALAALLVGLAFGNHLATSLLVPGCVWFLVKTREALSPRAVAAATAAFLAGVSVYLYLPWASFHQPAFNYAGAYDAAGRFVPLDLTTWRDFWWLVSGRGFSHQMLAYDLTELLAESGHFVAELWRAFSAVGLVPGLLGVWVMTRRDRRTGGMLLGMFVLSAGFYINYRALDKDTMFLPPYVIWALWLAVGYQCLLDWVERPDRARSPAAFTWVLRGVMVAGVLFAVVWTLPLVDLSDDWTTRQRGESILRHVEPEALVIGWWDTVPVVQYLQLVEGRRPDVVAVNRFLIAPEDLKILVRRQLSRRPVYFDTVPESWFPELEAEPHWPLYLLAPPEQPGGLADSPDFH